jgi:hypothetical protein
MSQVSEARLGSRDSLAKLWKPNLEQVVPCRIIKSSITRRVSCVSLRNDDYDSLACSRQKYAIGIEAIASSRFIVNFLPLGPTERPKALFAFRLIN